MVIFAALGYFVSKLCTTVAFFRPMFLQTSFENDRTTSPEIMKVSLMPCFHFSEAKDELLLNS